MLEAIRFKENTVFNRLDYIVQGDNQDSLIVIVILVIIVDDETFPYLIIQGIFVLN
jgi:hypothetical protein